MGYEFHITRKDDWTQEDGPEECLLLYVLAGPMEPGPATGSRLRVRGTPSKPGADGTRGSCSRVFYVLRVLG